MYPDTPAQDGENNKDADPVADISARLSTHETQENKDVVLNPKESGLPFDPTKLSLEQLQALKSMLAGTPEKRSRKADNPRVRMRDNNGKIICDHKRAKNILVDDPENNRKVFRHVIPVRHFGDPEDAWTEMMYNDFINLPQVFCEVVSQRSEKEDVVTGVVFSRELRREIEAVETKTHKWYTIKLPTGEQVEIPAMLANA